MRSPFKAALCFVFSLLIFVEGIFADNFKSLQDRYFKLRNTDAAIEDEAAWRTLAKELVDYADSADNGNSAGSSLYFASILFVKLFENKHIEDDLDKAIFYLNRLVLDYPHNTHADDALLHMGDLFLYQRNDKVKARSNYTEIIDLYPDSDTAEAARMRLKSMTGEKPHKISYIVGKHKGKANSRVVVIDPGHGGEDFGARGAWGLLEKDVVLDIAVRLEKKLKAVGVTVLLTRDRDEFVPLAERTALANKTGADLFISLHTNSSVKGDYSGIETFYLDNTEDISSRRLAERENRSYSLSGSGDLSFILSDLMQSSKLRESIKLGHVVQDSLIAALRRSHDHIVDRGVKKAPFYVLTGAHMPCILVEIFFINHQNDGRLLAEGKVRDEIAEALKKGIESFTL